MKSLQRDGTSLIRPSSARSICSAAPREACFRFRCRSAAGGTGSLGGQRRQPRQKKRDGFRSRQPIKKAERTTNKTVESLIKKQEHVSPPLTVQVTEQLSALDKTLEPLWSTFCGVTNGVWQGRMAAFFAATGKPEAVSLEGRTKLFDLHTLVVEERPEDDLIVRHTLRSPDLSVIRSASLPGLGSGEASNGASEAESSTLEQGWEMEELKDGEEGLVIFDGGSFSRGPQSLLAELPAASASAEGTADDNILEVQPEPGSEVAEEAEESGFLPSASDYGTDDSRRKTSVIEQCLAWGGEQRIRLQLTIAAGVGNGELDVEVLRLALWREGWQGLAETCAVDRCVAPDVQNPAESTSELSTAERTSPRAFEGTWKAYDLMAVPVDDEDPVTGEVKRACIYYGQETSQQWQECKAGQAGNEGAAIWLPNKILVELQMIPPSSRGSQGDKEEGMLKENPGRGFLITFSWAVKENTVIGMHREYDSSGELLECRNRTAVQGSWVGGRM